MKKYLRSEDAFHARLVVVCQSFTCCRLSVSKKQELAKRKTKKYKENYAIT